jgi:catechol 2,3-dioxygenase-like lactoylglutathione lyase family enzyme
MTQPKFDLIGIVVEDMAASLAFYRLLGLEPPADGESQPHVEVSLPGGLRLAWDSLETVRSFEPEYPGTGGAGIGLAFRVDNAAAVDATYGEITAAGYSGRREPWDAPWGQRYAQLEDPDGNTVDLFAPLS